MCRIFLCNNPSLLSEDLIHRTFENLVADAGGDGIGIGYYQRDIPVIIKAADMKVGYAARLVHRLDRPVMVHFRKASEGTKTNDSLCHPFETNEGLLCHNGGVAELLPHVKGSSDTAALASMINNMGFAKVGSAIHSYGVMAMLTPDGEFKIRRAKAHRYGSFRPFHEIHTEKFGEYLYIGISNPETMRSNWSPEQQGLCNACFGPYADDFERRRLLRRIQLGNKVFGGNVSDADDWDDDEAWDDTEASFLCALTPKQYEDIYGEPPTGRYRKNDKVLVSVASYLVEEYELQPLTIESLRAVQTPDTVVKETKEVKRTSKRNEKKEVVECVATGER